MLASGNQRTPGILMLRSLVEAAVQWMSSGLPLECLKIVLRPGIVPEELTRLREAFSEVREKYERSTEPAAPAAEFAFDLFVSYARRDGQLADELVGALRARDPQLRIFVDRLELNSGASWQQHIFEALDASRFILCLYSPAYLASKVCQEEFNVGLMRQRESEGEVMLPVYLFSAALPTYMKLIQYEDIREGDRIKIRELADRVLGRIRPHEFPHLDS